jgi:hypothetical protein
VLRAALQARSYRGEVIVIVGHGDLDPRTPPGWLEFMLQSLFMLRDLVRALSASECCESVHHVRTLEPELTAATGCMV